MKGKVRLEIGGWEKRREEKDKCDPLLNEHCWVIHVVSKWNFKNSRKYCASLIFLFLCVFERKAVCKSQVRTLVRYYCSCLKNTQVPRFINCLTFASSTWKENRFSFQHVFCLQFVREKHCSKKAVGGSWAGLTSAPGCFILTDYINFLNFFWMLIPWFKRTSAYLEWTGTSRVHISAKAKRKCFDAFYLRVIWSSGRVAVGRIRKNPCPVGQQHGALLWTELTVLCTGVHSLFIETHTLVALQTSPQHRGVNESALPKLVQSYRLLWDYILQV